jgi:hypothetical protein
MFEHVQQQALTTAGSAPISFLNKFEIIARAGDRAAQRAPLRGRRAAMDNAVGGYLVVVYGSYAVVSVALTVWIARTLFRNGQVFLDDVFADNPKLAAAVNRLLVVGFYLVNLGYASLLLKAGGADDAVQAIEVLSSKLGLLLLSLAAMHFGNLYVFHRIRRRAKLAVLPPPVAPQMFVPPYPREPAFAAPPLGHG